MFDTRAIVLRLEVAGEEPPGYSWQPSRSVWVHGEQTGRSNIFVKTGIGAAGTLFTLCQAGDITPNNLLLWRGGHYFLTSIEQKNPVTAEISAVRVTLRPCTATRPVKTKDEKGRPKNTQTPLIGFPAVVTEKYLRATQETPQTVLESTMILVTPKAVTLKTGDLVKTGSCIYAVLLCHTAGEWANEYEVVSTTEA